MPKFNKALWYTFSKNKRIISIMKEALVLLNMGGPNNLGEVEMFLHNMFNDPYIIRTKSNLLRRFIAGMITLTRAQNSQDIYRQIG